LSTGFDQNGKLFTIVTTLAPFYRAFIFPSLGDSRVNKIEGWIADDEAQLTRFPAPVCRTPWRV